MEAFAMGYTPASYTTNIPAQQQFTLRIDASGSDGSLESRYNRALGMLEDILVHYGSQQDKLSQHLRQWGLNWMNIVPKVDFEVVDNIDYADEQENDIAKADAALDCFSRDIEKQFGALKVLLRNYLTPDCCLVKEPMYDAQEDKVWDAADYHTYTQLSPYSPYSNRLFKAEAHPFAKAILEWRENFLADVCEPSPTFKAVHNTAISTFSSQQSMLMAMLNSPTTGQAGKLANYCLLALQNYKTKEIEKSLTIISELYERARAENAMLTECLAEEAKINQAMHQKLQMHRDEGRKRLVADQELRLDWQQSEYESLNKQLPAAEGIFVQQANLVTTLEGQLQTTQMKQAAIEEEKRQQLNALYQKHMAEKAELEQMLGKELLSAEANQLEIKRLNGCLLEVNIAREGRKAHIQTEYVQLAAQVHEMQEIIDSETQDMQQLQVDVAGMQSQKDALLGQLAEDREYYVQRSEEQRQALRGEQKEMIAQFSAEEQLRAEAHAAEFTRRQQVHQERLHLKIAVTKAANQAKLDAMQTKIHILAQDNCTFETSQSNLHSRLRHEVNVDYRNSHRVSILQRKIRSQSIELQKIAKKASKKRGFFG